jgi:hypothetical protein
MVFGNREACWLWFPDQNRSGRFSQNGRRWLCLQKNPDIQMIAFRNPANGYIEKVDHPG